MSADHPLTLTVEQAAAVLGIGRSTAYELVRSGDLPCLRLRRRIVVPVARLADRLGVSARDIEAAVVLPAVCIDTEAEAKAPHFTSNEGGVAGRTPDGSQTLF
jgi:excisionase family DNA binding protein